MNFNQTSAFDRYREIIPAYDDFLKALGEPVPVVIRANTLKIGTGPFRTLMAGRGYDLEPVPEMEEAFILRGIRGPGSTLEYLLGLYQIQGLTSMLPPKILAPQVGDRMLDLCAAPGGKATHLVQLTGSRNLLVANEPNPGRANILQGHIDRLGAASVILCRYDGCAFPKRMPFHRILLDPPCSAEGTFRTGSPLSVRNDPHSIERLISLQRKLLARALDLLHPEGILVYSTCTYAPEENECLINEVVSRGLAEILPVNLTFPHTPGLSAWQGQLFHRDLVHTVRIYPHQVNSWGFFIARLRRR